MSKRLSLGLLAVWGLSLVVLLIIFFRVNPYDLNEKELIFVLFWVLLFLFPLGTGISVLAHKNLMRRSFAQWLVLRQGFFFALYLTLLLALQMFRAFSILGAGILLVVFLLLELYFKN
ncbi:hypothetical protein J7K05_03055 [bacterium]|nr:hypothetical protein [bacterium]